MIYQCLLLSCNDLNVTHVDFSIPYSCCNCELAMRSVLLAQLLMANHEISSGFSSTKCWHINIFVMQITSLFCATFLVRPDIRGNFPECLVGTQHSGKFGTSSLNVWDGLENSGKFWTTSLNVGSGPEILGNMSLNVGSGLAFIKKQTAKKHFIKKNH